MKASNSNSSDAPYTPLLPDQQHSGGHHGPSKWSFGVVASIISLLALLAIIISQTQQTFSNHDVVVPNLESNNQNPRVVPRPRGVAEGVSAKSFPKPIVGDSYNWTDAMFLWQRTAYHFQPEKNWMNDPNGPLYHKGWYHIFYQYNPYSAIWGNITWGHAVSKDLIHWLHLPLAMVPDQWYDINGVWTGSATILPSGEIIILYTGDTNTAVQVQNLVVPANLSDPLLLDWVKYSGNPVLQPPSGTLPTDFRDPTTAWTGPDGTWRIAIGSKNGTTGVVLVYQTSDFKNFTLLDQYLHAVPGTGMWECVDFYPVAINGSTTGLDTSADGSGVKHVLKASLDNTRIDVYALGTYDAVSGTWRPDNPEEDVGIGLLYDYGKYYYASKTFFDPVKKRRILWGWINETDTEEDDVEKGWASVLNVPRTVLFDNKTGTNLLQWPVEEVETLRLNCTTFEAVVVGAGEVVALDVGNAAQLDIIAEFEIEDLESTSSNDTSGCGDGAADRSTYGPFGLLVLTDESFSELTPIYFRPSNLSNVTYFCADQTRSSLAQVYNHIYGGKVSVLDGENFTMRVLVDHSVVESFAQGGRTVVTSRIYPTEAIYGAAKLFLFNNATGINIKATLKVWQLNSAFIHPYPLDPIIEEHSSSY